MLSSKMDAYADEEGLLEAIGIAPANPDTGPTFDQLQTAFEAVTHSDLVQEDYDIVAQSEGMTAAGGVKLVLQNISVQLGVDLEPGWEEFTVTANKNDPQDVIDPR